MAICTSSQSISIWDSVEKSGGGADDSGWRESARISNAHSGPIWRLDWAHPQYGEVFASCSEDRTISIWSCTKGNQWKKRATLTDSPYAVTDVQFAPRSFGLKFAACTSDGMIRVYEASDPLNLSVWEVEDFSTAFDSSSKSSSEISPGGAPPVVAGRRGELNNLNIFFVKILLVHDTRLFKSIVHGLILAKSNLNFINNNKNVSYTFYLVDKIIKLITMENLVAHLGRKPVAGLRRPLHR
jgi:WD40 repeat protein